MSSETTKPLTVSASLKRIKQRDTTINSFLEVFTDAPADKIPIAVKDVICTTEGHTTAASKILENFRSPYDATVITKLKQAGYAVIGKVNCDEFAMGSSTEYSAYKRTKNPWDLNLVPGGSSGGSAAAVAAGLVDYALGTDTGGSIRQPSSFCGVVGLKPTYGRVSRFGIIPYGSSLDQVGPITRTVKDAARILAVIAGHDPADATSSPKPVDQYVSACSSKDLSNLTIGLPEEYFTKDLDESISKIVKQAVKQLANLGATIKNISLPLTSAAIPVYYLIAKAEASTNLGRYDALRYGPTDSASISLLEHYLDTRGRNFGPEVKRTILMGTYALSAGYVDAWYKQASRVRTLIRREFEQAFSKVDLIAGPTAPEVAFPFGAKADNPLAMYMSDTLTVPQSVAGLPAISVPCGFSNNLPVGLQLTAPHFKETKLIQTAHAYEQSTDWHTKSPQ